MERKIQRTPIFLSTLIHHVDIKAFTGKRNRVFCIILVLSASCALYFIFCFKQNSSFGNNVLRSSHWRHFIFLLSQSFVCVFHFELSSPFFTEKYIPKNYLKWLFKLLADSFSCTLSFPHSMLELLKYNGEFVFMRKKKFHLLLKFQKIFSSPPGKTRISSIEGVHFFCQYQFWTASF